MQYILIHGLGLSRNIWSKLIPRLDGSVIDIDLPGHGASTDDDYSWAGLWRVVNSHITEKSEKQKIILMHSFSAALIPEIVESGLKPDKVIFVEGIVHLEDAQWTKKINGMGGLDFENWAANFRRGAEVILRSQLIKKFPKEEIQFWSNSFRIVKGEALRSISRNLTDRLKSNEIIDAIKQAEFPILQVIGKQGYLSARGQYIFPNNSEQVIMLDNCGHFPMLDSPSELNNLL
jgi:pimeloyl-ACP methyl ester carboxylesterase